MVEVIETDDIDKVFTNVKLLSASGGTSCVMTGIYKNEERVLKVFSDLEAAEREAKMGHLLQDNPFFVKMFALVKSNQKVEKTKVGQAMNDSDCKKIIRGKVWIVVMEYLKGWQSLFEWKESIESALDREDIRSIFFDVVLAMSYANSKVGFQHNDLKPENIMCIDDKPVCYELGSDIFFVKNRKLKIKIIDLAGGSVGTLIPPQDKSYTEGYLAGDVTKQNITERKYYHDYAAIGVMLVDFLMQTSDYNDYYVDKHGGTKKFKPSPEFENATDEVTRLVIKRFLSVSDDRMTFCESTEEEFRYGFSNAIYHPYFAYYYWKKTKPTESVETITLAEPGKYLQDFANVTLKLQAFLPKKKTKSVDTDIILKAVKDIVNLAYIRTIAPSKGTNKGKKPEWGKFPQALVYSILQNQWREMMLVLTRHTDLFDNVPSEGIDLLPWKKSSKGEIIYQNAFKIGKGDQPAAVLLKNFAFGVPEENYVLQFSFVKGTDAVSGEDFLATMSLRLVFFVAVANLISGITIDEKVYTDAYKNIAPESIKNQDELVRNVRNTLSKLNVDLTFDALKAAITLESIERNKEFLVAEGIYDFNKIQTQLYNPIRQLAEERVELTSIRDHMNFDKDLTDHWSGDFTTQTKYLHTLSIVADMIGKESFPQEQQERCYVEWTDQKGKEIHL